MAYAAGVCPAHVTAGLAAPGWLAAFEAALDGGRSGGKPAVAQGSAGPQTEEALQKAVEAAQAHVAALSL